MTDIDYLENLFDDKTCKNCIQATTCHKRKNTCDNWVGIDDFLMAFDDAMVKHLGDIND